MKKDIFLGSALAAVSLILLAELRKTKNPAIMADQVSAATFPNLLVGMLMLLAALLIISSVSRLKRKKNGRPRPKTPGRAGAG